MLTNVVIGTGLLVEPVEALVSSVGHIFLVHGPRNMPVLKQVNYRGDILRDLSERVIIKTKVLSAIG